jgi:hypothetical protein
VKSYIKSLAALVILALVVGTVAQDEEPQLAEYFCKAKREVAVPQWMRAISLDGAFQAVYDLDFDKADLIQPRR